MHLLNGDPDETEKSSNSSNLHFPEFSSLGGDLGTRARTALEADSLTLRFASSGLHIPRGVCDLPVGEHWYPRQPWSLLLDGL